MLQKVKGLAKTAAHKSLDFVKRQVKPLVAIAVAGITAVLFTIGPMKTVRIFDGEQTYTIRTFTCDAIAAMKQIPLKSGNYKVTGIAKSVLSTDVQIAYVYPLTVTIGSDTETYDVAAGRLGDILNELGIQIDEYDIVSRSLDDVIQEAAAVDIVDIDYVTESYAQDIPYNSNVVYSDQYTTSTHVVANEGETGTKVITCSVKYVNGVAQETTILGEEVVKQAVDQTTIVGTRIQKMASTPQAAGAGRAASSVGSISTLTPPSGLTLDQNGVPTNYTSTATLKASAYTYTGNNCATGVAPQPGYIAVNPKEIPYGTRMYIVSADGKYVYGYAVAADTGGFIHMNRDLDLFFHTESECQSFGVRDVVVYFLD